MNLAATRSLVSETLQRMAALYSEPVFDEWVVVSFQEGHGAILAYAGPRTESYRKQFAADVVPLRQEMEGKNLAAGDFLFAPEAAGTHFDACVRLGPASYLICNHTSRSMAEIRRSPHWLRAQKPFVEMGEKFRADPLA